ncbi:Dual specificity protein phosphatase 1B [Cercospora beticola]|uniref:Dual specificity protein phosphatase 1B n=1 Tax=Cercospora beticola TaxID=122368 RepID=A0A2G5I0B9_CERBT|nr:Dual specificity protein phosphatase 1B [Cercospora beticola]PIA98201.1 Dual specificity protein phosphatase 1B [Cercospora beticola]WPA98471.1 hypothetical protein RHO25_003083 [Cercospora beticola]
MARFWEFAQLTDGWKNASYFDEIPLSKPSATSVDESTCNKSSGTKPNVSDESMQSQGKLYIGGIAAVYQNPSPLKKAGVTHVVSLLDWEMDEEGRKKVAEVTEAGKQRTRGAEIVQGDDRWLRIDVEDDERQDLAKWFEKTNHFIHQGLQEGGGVFVHCAMGVSRSATIVCAFLMWRFEVGREEALEWVRRGRARCRPNDGFWEQLGLYEKALQERRKMQGIPKL